MGKIIGFELNSQDPDKLVEFYRNVFGWEISEPHWDYCTVTFKESSTINGGIAKGPFDFPHGTRIQIEVDSIEETLEKAKKYGAMVVREKMEFEDFYLAYLEDPVVM